MRLRDRFWGGLGAPGIALEAGIALLAGGSVLLGVGSLGPVPLAELALVPGALLVAALFLFLRRRAPLVPFAAGAALAAASVSLLGPLLFSTYAVGRYAGSWRIRAGAAVVGGVAVLVPLHLDSVGDWIAGVGSVALIVVLPGAIGVWQRTRTELLAALRDRAERAEAERELLAREAVLGERTRIARETHDAVGHRVSLMVLQAGAIEMAAQDADRVAQLAGNVQDAGRQALDELRQMVGVLRGTEVDEAAPLGPQPGLEDVPRLVEEARRAGMSVDLAGEPARVDPAVGRAAYRIVQEALTNAGKHAPGAPVAIALDRSADGLAVRVLNGAPTGVPAGTSGGGYGLVGLAERVRTLGGRFAAEPRLDGGFCVEAVLPA
ncbi:histidine kinase [Blastococcus montanus]|uniref:sensor histidine kinase n=1 Tax=Blastococcus montanus TaxID=3144973 RepID=UPI003207B91B